MVLSEDDVEEILSYLERSITHLAGEASENLGMKGSGLEGFLQGQFDLRLDRMLEAKNSNIHHLETGMKNKVIRRRRDILDGIMRG